MEHNSLISNCALTYSSKMAATYYKFIGWFKQRSALVRFPTFILVHALVLNATRLYCYRVSYPRLT